MNDLIEEPQATDHGAVASASSDAGSEDSEMEPFTSYLPKIELLLNSIGLDTFSVEPLHHDYTYQNCVYALKSTQDQDEKYILRIPNCPDFYSEAEGREVDHCQSIINDAALLGYLADKLPVSRVKAYSATRDNPLNTPFSVQTRIAGTPLEDVYTEMSQTQKLSIVDQFVELLANHESITFDAAGSLAAPTGSPVQTHKFYFQTSLSVAPFLQGDEDFVRDASTTRDRQGSSIKSLLASHIKGWIAKEHTREDVHQKLYLPLLNRLLTMIDDKDREGFFQDEPYPIVLYHWDLEPRNIMVNEQDGYFIITGVIDWDGTIAVPRPLARKPPSWIWDFNPDSFTGYLDNDHHTNPTEDSAWVLSEEDQALKAHWDTKAAATFQDYLEDAYGRGWWWRRMWLLVRFEIHTECYLDLATWFLRQWDERHCPETSQLEKLNGLWSKSPEARAHFQALEAAEGDLSGEA